MCHTETPSPEFLTLKYFWHAFVVAPKQPRTLGAMELFRSGVLFLRAGRMVPNEPSFTNFVSTSFPFLGSLQFFSGFGVS